MLLIIDPVQYSDKVVIERGRKVIYVELSMTLYGTLTVSLFFWKDLTKSLPE